MREFGLFNDGGCVEAGFFSRQEAEEALRTRYSEEDGLEVAAICPDHPEQEDAFCEECNAEEE